MAIAFDAVASGSSGNPVTSISWSHTCTGNNRMMFVFTRGGGSQGDRVTGVTYNGVSLTKLTTVTVAGDNAVLSMYYLVNPSSGTNTVQVNLSSGFIEANSISYTGVDQISPINVHTTNTASSTTSISTNIVPTKDKTWTVLFARTNATSNSAGSGSTFRTNVNGDFTRIYDSGSEKTPPGTVTMVINSGGTTNFAVILASFAPVSAASSILPALL